MQLSTQTALLFSLLVVLMGWTCAEFFDDNPASGTRVRARVEQFVAASSDSQGVSLEFQTEHGSLA